MNYFTKHLKNILAKKRCTNYGNHTWLYVRTDNSSYWYTIKRYKCTTCKKEGKFCGCRNSTTTGKYCDDCDRRVIKN